MKSKPQVRVFVDFDFGKLAKRVNRMTDTLLVGLSRSFAKGSKEAIKNKDFENKTLEDSTLYVRKKGLSPRHRVPFRGKNPLRHSGTLFKSIKVKGGKEKVNGKNKKVRFLEMAHYGKYHIEGYTVGSNKFADRMNFTGEKVPARNFLKADKKIGRKAFVDFRHNIKRHLLLPKFTELK